VKRIAAWLLLAAAVGCRSRPAEPPPTRASGLRPRASGETASGPRPIDAPKLLPSLAFAPAIVELVASPGERRSQDARIIGPLAPQAHLTIEHVDDPALDVQPLTPDGSDAAGLRLAFVGDRAGVRTGQVVAATGLDEPPRVTLLYSLRVPSRITVTPSNPVFDLRDPAGRERRLEVRGRGPAFRATAVQVLAGPFRATVGADGAASGGVAAIRVSVDEPAIRGNPEHGFLGRLRIDSNDPAQPTADVPLYAMGALPPHPPASDARGHVGNEPIQGGDATAKAR